jgi:alanine racemase
MTKLIVSGMNKGPKALAPMRSALFHQDSLARNLSDIVLEHGPETVLDLRGNAYGVGAEEVAALAHDVGFRLADYGHSHTGARSLTHTPGAHPVGGWWSGPGGEVLTLSAEVISLKRVPAGSQVSYGYHYQTTAETTLALVALGYADGVPRTTSGAARVSLGGILVEIAGRIAMDQFVLDAGDHETAIGDHAMIWGAEPTLSQWATWSNRPSAALLAHLGSRVVKQWV